MGGESGVYHIVARGVARQIIFEDNQDRQVLLDALARTGRKYRASILAWCFMDNHIHLLMMFNDDIMSNYMKCLLSFYARYFNMAHERVGGLFQGRFLSKPIDSDEYLLATLRYIHMNPEAAGIARLELYPWSSYQEYLGQPRVIDPSLVLSMFSSREEFARFHRLSNSTIGLDIDETRWEEAEHLSRETAIDELGEDTLRNVKSLPKPERNQCIARLRARGLSIRQIERLTGVSRGIIGRIDDVTLMSAQPDAKVTK